MLVIDMSINRKETVATLAAIRVSPDGEISSDDIATYEVGYVFTNKIDIKLCSLQHRYGDGAMELSRKVLEAAVTSSITLKDAIAAYKMLCLEKN